MKENNVDVWDAFLNTLEDRGLSTSEWEVSSEVQEELVGDFKSKIDAGVVDGKTALPPDLIWNEYIWRFPDEMRQKLTAHAERVLETDPDNGAAVKFLAVVEAKTAYDPPTDEFWRFWEKAAMLLPNEIDICYLAFENATFDILFDEGVVALERLFERHREGEKPTLDQWLFRCYDYFYVVASPNDFYKELDSNDPLYDRWTAVMGEIQTVFQERLARNPDDRNIIRMLTEIYGALGHLEAAQAVLEKALKVKADPSLGWVGQVLPDFAAPVVDLDGEPISLADYRGKVVLLDFWAMWCGPCIGEIPGIKRVYKKYRYRGFEVIGVSLDEDEAALRKYIKEHEMPWRQIFECQKWEGRLVQQYGVRGIPAPFLIDREGKVISVKARGSLLDELVEAEIERKAN